MADKSGIEMLEEILNRLDIMEKRIDLIDSNIKKLMNGSNLSKLIQKASGTPLDDWAKATKPGLAEIPDVKKKIEEIKKNAGFKNFSFQATDAAKIKQAQPDRGAKAPVAKPKSIMVKGKLKIEKGDEVIPLSSALVKIFDSKDKLVKETKTNRAGHWMSQLTPGKYVVLFEGEFDGKKLLPQNKNFEVPEKLPNGQTEFEVI